MTKEQIEELIRSYDVVIKETKEKFRVEIQVLYRMKKEWQRKLRSKIQERPK